MRNASAGVLAFGGAGFDPQGSLPQGWAEAVVLVFPPEAAVRPLDVDAREFATRAERRLVSFSNPLDFGPEIREKSSK